MTSTANNHPEEVEQTLIGGTEKAISQPSKTPLYKGINALRYQRQAAIKVIEESTGRHLISYVSGINTMIDRDDTIGFVDLLHNIPNGEDLDLILHTAGGDVDAAEKLMTMIRTKVGTATLRVVVPDFAKSAGTLMAIGADFIVMSDSSELGPIDPQIVLADDRGNRIQHRVQSYLDAYTTHSKTLKGDPTNVVAQMMLSKLDPATLELFQGIRLHAIRIAESQLRQGMFRTNGNWSQTASELMSVERWQSHAEMISWKDASDPKLQLSIEYLQPTDEIWQQYWQLYCLQRLAIKANQKLYESSYASILMDSEDA